MTAALSSLLSRGLHTAFCTPIIHRGDIKSSNIFLDPQTVSKLSGFELSIVIPEGKTHVEDQLIGTRGYISPNYLCTNLVTEKNDVYSFGLLLMELVTGRKPVIDDCSHIETYFRTRVLSNEYNLVLDPTVLEELGQIDVQQQVQAVSELALRCTENVNERPAMVGVARKLLQLRRTTKDR